MDSLLQNGKVKVRAVRRANGRIVNTVPARLHVINGHGASSSELSFASIVDTGGLPLSPSISGSVNERDVLSPVRPRNYFTC